MTTNSSRLNRYGQLLTHYLKPLRLKVALLGVLIFSTIGLQLLNPQIIRLFIDQALAKAASQTLLWAALAFLGSSLLLHGINLAATYLSEDVGWRATNQLRTDLALHCLHLDMSFHHTHTPGAMVERIDGDVAEIANFFAQFALRMLGNLLLILGILLVLWREDWRLSLALALFAGLAVVGFTAIRDIAVADWESARQVSAELFGFLEEHLAGAEDLRANRAVDYVLHHLFKFDKERLDKALKGESMTGRGLTLRYPDSRRGIENVNLHLMRGSFMVIVGQVGAGKTTLLHVLLGLLPKDAGELRWNGELVEQPSEFLCRHAPPIRHRRRDFSVTHCAPICCWVYPRKRSTWRSQSMQPC